MEVCAGQLQVRSIDPKSRVKGLKCTIFCNYIIESMVYYHGTFSIYVYQNAKCRTMNAKTQVTRMKSR